VIQKKVDQYLNAYVKIEFLAEFCLIPEQYTYIKIENKDKIPVIPVPLEL
jgi:hypothetical protein